MASDTHDDGEGNRASLSPEAIRLTIPREYYLLPGFMATAGATIGLFRGTRTASLQFLAENAHRAPKTLQGWYFYNKTKNYRMILGGLRQGGVDGIRMGITGMGWVGFEEGLRRAGLDEVKEVGAGVGTAGTFSAIYRLPWIAARRAMLLGLLAGTTMRILRLAKERMQVEVERRA
ncbi:hypothetical protein JB92DRAFT_2973525 [Gautieria morchelliformis]|nr:hypothetical protein JB92DRAFT_2973525 [Gautieria morchelliformis]